MVNELDAQIAEYLKVDDPESKRQTLELTERKNELNYEINHLKAQIAELSK